MEQMQILEGISVLDFSHIVAGPHCTRLMAEHGADVIKVEPLTGDPVRGLPYIKDGRSGCYVQHNIGKQNMCMDLTRLEAKDICYELVKQSDVVVENFAPGVMKRLQLDWETLKEINPELIMCSISCFGQTGPLSELPGYDFIGQSYAGILDMNGEPGGSPIFTDLAFGDVSTGAHAYGAIVSALFHKLRGNGGQHIDISLIDVLFSYHEMGVEVYDGSNGKLKLSRSGRHHQLVSPCGIYSCGGRYIFLIANRDQWIQLANLIGRPDMVDDPRYADIVARGKNRDGVDKALQSWLDSVNDAEEAVKLLQKSRVPSALILSIPEVMSHPHMQTRGIVKTVSDPVFGQLKIPNSPFRYSQFPENLDLSADFLGQSNRKILATRLNYNEQQINLLEASGVIATKNI